MCARCRAEYENPLHRRFHAQPNACPDCGPCVELWEPLSYKALCSHHSAIKEAGKAICNGSVLAVKGLGGFHLMVDARREEVVRRLRKRKHREEKPFAVMFPSLVPPAMEAILASPRNCVQGFLAAGHVCTVMGFTEYGPIAEKYRVPIVVTGFEPLDILQGVYMCVQQLEQGRADVENQYTRSVRREGNQVAQRLIRDVFRVIPRKWRGVGEIPCSGFALSEKYADFDAERRFGVADYTAEESGECISGLILQGVKKPQECLHSAPRCTPEHPLGATIVSSEGACAAYYQYRRDKL